MGGIYYVRNILKTLSHAQWMHNNSIHLFCPSEHLDIFKSLSNEFPKFTIHIRPPRGGRWHKILDRRLGPVIGKFDADLIRITRNQTITHIFPIQDFPYAGVRATQVHWIPDFQHFKLPECFPASERNHRSRVFHRALNSKRPTLVSSQNAKAHLQEFHPNHRSPVFVVPFISDIEDEIRQLTPDREFEILSRHGLSTEGRVKQFLYIPNQFWKHKNHILVVKALAELRSNGAVMPHVVCTGSMSDHRGNSHITELAQLIQANSLSNHFQTLGFVNRLDQIAIMKSCHGLIQPSLFEGWNTGVQEAKRLGRHLLLSDIPIHREQNDGTATFFAPDDHRQLARSMLALLARPSSITRDVDLLHLQQASATKYAEGAKGLFSHLDC